MLIDVNYVNKHYIPNDHKSVSPTLSIIKNVFDK